MSDVKIIKPIAKYAHTTSILPIPQSVKPLAVAGTTIKEGSVVYLLRQLPQNFLLTDFYDPNVLYNRIPIHGWNQHLIGPGLFQEWILTIKSARTPDEQNLEFFQTVDTNLFGFRTTRLVVPDEPLLAWFSLSQLRTICEKIKLNKIFKVEELLKSTRCPRCKTEQNYLNVLVAHVLRDQCQDVHPPEQLFIPHSPIKKRSIPQTKIEEKKSVDSIPFSSNDVSSYKMSVLDGTQALEFTSLDNDGRQRKAHLCLFCGKIYNRKYGLKIHLRTHTGYKPLQCRVCFRPFSDPSNLNKHIRLHSTSSSSTTTTTTHKQSNVDSDDEDSHMNTLDED